MKTIVIVPTYNEIENIPQLLKEVQSACADVDLLVVDDNSPDGTADFVAKESANNPRVHLLKRQNKQGLGKAYIAGFHWAIERGYDWIVEMDADFSHRPVDLASMLSKRDQADFIVGSRYVAGGSTVNWGLLRKIISRGGGFYSRWILGYPLRDWTGGFNAWKSSVLVGIDYLNLKSNGYSFQIELKYRSLLKGFKGIEHPIVFEDRRVGQSKMSTKIVLEALYKVWMIRFGS